MSVLRLTALFGLCMMVVLLVAVAALWLVLNAAGVFDSLSKTIATVNDSSESSAGHWFSFSRVMAITAIVGLIQVVVFSLLSSVVALLYNLCSDFVGGVEVTLSEK
jgi:hypothetical protein